MAKKLTTKEFVVRANKKHGGRYDYSKVEYINSYTPVVITCRIHGDFLQSPDKHLYKKANCPKCAHNNRYSKTRTTTKKFIAKAKQIHGDTYLYNLVKYKNSRTLIDINCKLHGVFKQLPRKHLEGQGCPVCSRSTISKIKKDKYNLRGVADFLISISKIAPVTFEYVMFFTGLAYSSAVHFVRRNNIHIIKAKNNISENKLYNLIKKVCDEHGIYTIVRNDRTILKPNLELNHFKHNHEIDIYIPDLKLGFEFNGMYWHRNKPKGYHMEKYNTAKHCGITLYHIWEDEYSCEEDIEFWNEEIRDIIYNES